MYYGSEAFDLPDVFDNEALIREEIDRVTPDYLDVLKNDIRRRARNLVKAGGHPSEAVLSVVNKARKQYLYNMYKKLVTEGGGESCERDVFYKTKASSESIGLISPEHRGYNYMSYDVKESHVTSSALRFERLLDLGIIEALLNQKGIIVKLKGGDPMGYRVKGINKYSMVNLLNPKGTQMKYASINPDQILPESIMILES